MAASIEMLAAHYREAVLRGADDLDGITVAALQARYRLGAQRASNILLYGVKHWGMVYGRVGSSARHFFASTWLRAGWLEATQGSMLAANSDRPPAYNRPAVLNQPAAAAPPAAAPRDRVDVMADPLPGVPGWRTGPFIRPGALDFRRHQRRDDGGSYIDLAAGT